MSGGERPQSNTARGRLMGFFGGSGNHTRFAAQQFLHIFSSDWSLVVMFFLSHKNCLWIVNSCKCQ